MASGISVMVKALNINCMHVDKMEYVEGYRQIGGSEYAKDSIVMHVRPYNGSGSSALYAANAAPSMITRQSMNQNGGRILSMVFRSIFGTGQPEYSALNMGF